jgi:hypothetical protein
MTRSKLCDERPAPAGAEDAMWSVTPCEERTAVSTRAPWTQERSRVGPPHRAPSSLDREQGGRGSQRCFPPPQGAHRSPPVDHSSGRRPQEGARRHLRRAAYLRERLPETLRAPSMPPFGGSHCPQGAAATTAPPGARPAWTAPEARQAPSPRGVESQRRKDCACSRRVATAT